jgi:hypothetical protein
LKAFDIVAGLFPQLGLKGGLNSPSALFSIANRQQKLAD